MNQLWLLIPDDRADLVESQRRLKLELKACCPSLANELLAIDSKQQQPQPQPQPPQHQQEQQQSFEPPPPQQLQVLSPELVSQLGEHHQGRLNRFENLEQQHLNHMGQRNRTQNQPSSQILETESINMTATNEEDEQGAPVEGLFLADSAKSPSPQEHLKEQQEEHELEKERVVQNELSQQEDADKSIADTDEEEKLISIEKPLTSASVSSSKIRTRTLDYQVMQIEDCDPKSNQRVSNVGCIKKVRNFTQKRRKCCCFCAIALAFTGVLFVWLFYRFVLLKEDSETKFTATSTTSTVQFHTTRQMFAPRIKTAKIMTDCYDWLLHIGEHSLNGVYEINPTGNKSFNVYCDMKSNGGGWTVFQRRTTAQIFDFTSKLWAEYEEGFNDTTHENFWLGNEKIHALSAKDNLVDLRADMWTDSSEQNYLFGEYSNFKIENEANNYVMTISTLTHGNATSPSAQGGSILFNSGLPFSTIDRNAKDGYCTKIDASECAETCVNVNGTCEDYCSGDDIQFGGWWMDTDNGCGHVSLNGRFNKGFVWKVDKETNTKQYFLLRSEMKLRKTLKH